MNYGLRYEINGPSETPTTWSQFFDPTADTRRWERTSAESTTWITRTSGRTWVRLGHFGNGRIAVRAGYSLTFDVANFGALASPYSFVHAHTGVFTQTSLGFFNVSNSSDVAGGARRRDCRPTDPGSDATTRCIERAGDYICFNSATNGPLLVRCHYRNRTVQRFSVVKNFKTPRYHNFNFSIQRELFKNNVSDG